MRCRRLSSRRSPRPPSLAGGRAVRALVPAAAVLTGRPRSADTTTTSTPSGPDVRTGTESRSSLWAVPDRLVGASPSLRGWTGSLSLLLGPRRPPCTSTPSARACWTTCDSRRQRHAPSHRGDVRPAAGRGRGRRHPARCTIAVIGRRRCPSRRSSCLVADGLSRDGGPWPLCAARSVGCGDRRSRGSPSTQGRTTS